MSVPAIGDRVWLIDANNIIHRQFHALPIDKHRARPVEGDPTTEPGWPINAVVGWLRSLRGLRKHHGNDARFIVPIFDDHDKARTGWRHGAHPGYKASRKPSPPELVAQWPLIDELTKVAGLPHVWAPGVEADDLIASYTEVLVARGCRVTIASNDKDLSQLVRGEDERAPGSVRMLARSSGDLVLMGPAEVEAKFGVGPDRLVDLLGLAGDTGDDIPGIAGVGRKTAARLLREHGDLESVLERWALIQGALAAKVRDGAESARMSRRLVSLRSDLTPPVPVENLRPWAPRRGDLDAFFQRLGFTRFEAAIDGVEE